MTVILKHSKLTSILKTTMRGTKPKIQGKFATFNYSVVIMNLEDDRNRRFDDNDNQLEQKEAEIKSKINHISIK